MAAATSSRVLPGRAAATPASIASRVAADEAACRLGRPSPTSQVRALSPCQPSTMAPQSTETTWPSRMRRSSGTPWTTSSSMETQTVWAKGPSGPGTPMNDGVPPRERMTSAAMASSSRGVMPGRMASPTASSASPTSRPATAMRSICDLDLSVTRRRSKSIAQTAELIGGQRVKEVLADRRRQRRSPRTGKSTPASA